MNRALILTLFAMLSLHQALPGAPGTGPIPAGTYSIVARDPVTGDLGIAVHSRLLAVGAVVPFAKANNGAIATQARANTVFGTEGLRMLGYGWTAQEVLDSLLVMDPERESRQVGIVDRTGNPAAYTGSACASFAGHRTGQGYVVQGSTLAGAGVLEAMASAFERTPGDLADRMIAALTAGDRAGGEIGGERSAALLIVREGGGYGGLNDRFVDLRVDDSPDPAGELKKIYGRWSTTDMIEARMQSIDRFNRDKQFSAAQEETRRVVESLNAQLRDNPDDPEVLSRVAWTLSTYDIAKDRALDLAVRAAKISPGNPSIMSTLAECNYRLGKVDEAIAIASELVAKEPGNDTFWKQLQKFREAKGR